jgi:hypothetical protein
LRDWQRTVDVRPAKTTILKIDAIGAQRRLGPRSQRRNIATTSSGGIMRNALFTLALACSTACATGASPQGLPTSGGRLVTPDDIAGKKICWDSGHWSFYESDGHFSNDHGDRHHHWSVPEPGVIKTGQSYRQTEVQADGQFHSQRFVGHRTRFDRHVDHWGNVCA